LALVKYVALENYTKLQAVHDILVERRIFTVLKPMYQKLLTRTILGHLIG